MTAYLNTDYLIANRSIRTGYDPKFLGNDYPVPLPVVGISRAREVLTKESLRDGYVADYVHYSVVISQSKRQAFFTAANFDQNTSVSATGRRWFIDDRIGIENQIGNEVYANNPWDRGHLTRRASVTWGNPIIAEKASLDSCSYANACLQHENFNQDEWRVPEEVVKYFDRDRDGKLSVFTGPIFTETDRWYTPEDRQIEPARIPSAFWKIIFYVSKESSQLECQAYLLYQDRLFMADKRGRLNLDIRNYQVTTTEIEQYTGLEFSEVLYQSNPLFFYPRENINVEPESVLMPKSTQSVDLKEGVVFTRQDMEKETIKYRKLASLQGKRI